MTLYVKTFSVDALKVLIKDVRELIEAMRGCVSVGRGGGGYEIVVEAVRVL